MFKASSHRLLTMLLAAGVTIAVVVGLARATAPSNDVESPSLKPRTPVAGADKGGLFGDGVTNLPKVDTKGWKTYSNAKYGYRFIYPPDWLLQETDNSSLHGPNGEPAYPLQAVDLTNPPAEAGQNILGQNCDGDGCIGAPPRAMAFLVHIVNGLCNRPGDLIASDTLSVSGATASRCVLASQSANAVRTVSLGFPLGDGTNFVEVTLQRGRDVEPAEQAILETILASLVLTKGSTP
jgi:hypothetical protein